MVCLCCCVAMKKRDKQNAFKANIWNLIGGLTGATQQRKSVQCEFPLLSFSSFPFLGRVSFLVASFTH